MQNVAHYVPMRLQEFLYDHLPGKGLEKARFNRRVAHKVANQLLDMKTEELLVGKGNRDIMSILGQSFIASMWHATDRSAVKANASESERMRLSHQEIVSQMRSVLISIRTTFSNDFYVAGRSSSRVKRQPQIRSAGV